MSTKGLRFKRDGIRGQRLFECVTHDSLCKLFGIKPDTLIKWIAKGLLDPTNLFDIIDKYNNRWKLDKRRKSNLLR